VPLVRLLPERTRRFAREAVAFSVAGLTSTALDFAIFNGLIFLGPLQANLISAVIATTLSFSMNRRWTYRDRPRTAVHREIGLFFAVNWSDWASRRSCWAWRATAWDSTSPTTGWR
jgi:Predicted membrane protein